jgi:peptide/nickel transport system ATP-binding protein
MAEPLLEVRGLVTEFRTDQGPVRAVDGISFEVPRRGTLGVVGESGCGKSVTALSIMRLIAPPGRIAAGEIRYGGRDLLSLPEPQMRAIRGNRIAMIFQEPMTSLNPVFTVGDQVGEAVRLHQKKSRRDARQIAIEMFRLVGIPSPEERVDAYPHQLSGGMRQRVMIAMALACKPDLLIADEPTTALDVTIQAQILDLLRSLQAELGMSVLLITHDLGVVAGLCDRVNVMYSGRIVEQADRRTLFVSPRHPYTTGLLGSIPRLDSVEGSALQPIPGSPTDTLPWSSACAFAPRCTRSLEVCTTVTPELEPDGPRWLRCHNPVPAEEAAAVGAEGRRE